MFRAAVLSIVLTLAAGPVAAAVCRASCPPHPAAAETCRDHAATPSARLLGTATCDDPGSDAVPFVREEARRVASGHDTLGIQADGSRRPSALTGSQAMSLPAARLSQRTSLPPRILRI